MFTRFFYDLRRADVPVSLKEYLLLLDAVKAGAAGWSVDDFYYLSRSALVKNERHIDRFDQVFGHVFQGLELLDGLTRRGTVVGVDLVEVAPDYDHSGSTTTLAAQLLLNFIGRILHHRK